MATLLRVLPLWCLEMKFQVIFNRLTMKNFTLQFVFSMLVNQTENLILAQVSLRTLFLCFVFFCLLLLFFWWFLGVADTNDVIQKIEKTLNNTHTTTQKLTNNSFRNTKKHPFFPTELNSSFSFVFNLEESS